MNFLKGSYFLDTNIIVEFFRGNTRVPIYLAENKRFVISTIVLGELEFGVQNAKKAAKNTKQLKDFMTGVQVINLDDAKHSSETDFSRSSVGTDDNDDIQIRTNNSFLHDNVD